MRYCRGHDLERRHRRGDRSIGGSGTDAESYVGSKRCVAIRRRPIWPTSEAERTVSISAHFSADLGRVSRPHVEVTMMESTAAAEALRNCIFEVNLSQIMMACVEVNEK